MKLSLSKQVRAAVMAAVLCVTSQVAVGVGDVPLTLQTFFIALTGVVLGARLGALTVAVYLLVGACGLPVYAGGLGGVGRLLGPTGGFLVGFALLAFFCGLGGGGPYWRQFLWSLLGLVALDALGTAQLMFVARLSLPAALASAVLPFVAKDIACLAAAIALGRIVKNRLPAQLK